MTNASASTASIHDMHPGAASSDTATNTTNKADAKPADLTRWGTVLRVIAWGLVAVAVGLAIGFGAHFGLAYLVALGLEATWLLVAKAAIYLIAGVSTLAAAWKIGAKINEILIRRAISKLSEDLAE